MSIDLPIRKKVHLELQKNLKLKVSENQLNAILKDLQMKCVGDKIQITDNGLTMTFNNSGSDFKYVIEYCKASYLWFDILHGKEKVEKYVDPTFDIRSMF